MTMPEHAGASRGRRRLLGAAALAAVYPPLVRAAQTDQAAHTDAPAVIRIGAPAYSGTTQTIWGAVGIARARGLFDGEFTSRGIRLEFPGFKGGGPAVAQALANDQFDFAGNGDLISIIGRSSGMKTRLLMPANKLENAYLAVPKGSGIKRVEDLRGQRLAFFKGNYIHLQVIRILAAHGMSEKDVRAVNLPWAQSGPALISGDVDAVFGGTEVLAVRDRGAADVVYSTQGHAPRQTAQAGILVRDAFAARYPDVTARFVKVLVRAADWGSDPANRAQVLDIWTSSHRTRAQLEEDYGGRPLAERLSPLLDPFFIAQYQDTEQLAARLGLLRGPRFAIGDWFDGRPLAAALTALALERRWQPLPADGAVAQPA